MAALSKILYVEDEPSIRMIAQIALETVGGFTLRTCSSGREAMTPESIAFAPDIIVLDVMLPEMDGPTILLHMRQIEAFANTPVVFMTAKVQANEVGEYLDLGAIGVIPKPFDPMTLSSQLQEIWDARHLP
ncbi:MAG: response regulator [Pseudomonadota bacterium]